MASITKTISLDLEVTVSFSTSFDGPIEDFEIMSITGLTPLIQLNGPRRQGTHRDKTVGMVLDVDEFSSIPKLEAKAWINWSDDIEAAVLAQMEDAIYDTVHDNGD